MGAGAGPTPGANSNAPGGSLKNPGRTLNFLTGGEPHSRTAVTSCRPLRLMPSWAQVKISIELGRKTAYKTACGAILLVFKEGGEPMMGDFLVNLLGNILADLIAAWLIRIMYDK